jgi:hypothetical protein
MKLEECSVMKGCFRVLISENEIPGFPWPTWIGIVSASGVEDVWTPANIDKPSKRFSDWRRVLLGRAVEMAKDLTSRGAK